MSKHLLAIMLFTTLSVPSGAAIVSQFSTDAESWTGVTANPSASGLPVVLNGLSVNYLANGGNPDGYISLDDADVNDTFFRAPLAFLGNQSSALNGILQYDLITDSSPDYPGPNVVIKGGGLTLVYALSSQPAVQNVWTTVIVPLTANANWHLNTPSGAAPTAANFAAALASVSDLWISAETHDGVVETSGIDNVQLTSSVPEPSSLILAGAGMAGLLLHRRRAN